MGASWIVSIVVFLCVTGLGALVARAMLGRKAPSKKPKDTRVVRTAAHTSRSRANVQADGATRELQATVPHLFSLLKLPPAPNGLAVPTSENADAATAELRRWLRDMSGRVGRRTDMLNEVHRAGWDPKALADLVQRDPLLAGSILKIINSGFYGLRQRAASVLQAVLLLGVVEVRNLIYRACMSESLGLDHHPARQVIDEVWTHSFAASRIAYAMARKAGHPKADEVSTATLLHDVGKIVFLAVAPDRARGLYDGTPFSDHTRLNHEIAEFGVTHARMSATLSEAWGLPGKTIATIALHHAPTYLDVRSLEGPSADIALVHAADLLAHLDPRGRIPVDAPPRPAAGWLEALGLGLDERERSRNTAETRAMTRPSDDDETRPLERPPPRDSRHAA